jgi:hypothetical protein
MLTATQGFSARIKFFEDRQYVALFDGGPCGLVFTNGKEYSFSTWMPGWIENPVFPKGSANIACIADYHYQIVSDEALADMTHFAPSGEITYYKAGELEIVAHSETPFNSQSEWVIVCNKKQYKVVHTRKRFGYRAELYQDNQSVASINQTLFWATTNFKKTLPLSERVFITLLAGDWWPESTQIEQVPAEKPTATNAGTSGRRLAFTDSTLSSDTRAADQ